MYPGWRRPLFGMRGRANVTAARSAPDQLFCMPKIDSQGDVGGGQIGGYLESVSKKYR
jgi:hypothetical protein